MSTTNEDDLLLLSPYSDLELSLKSIVPKHYYSS